MSPLANRESRKAKWLAVGVLTMCFAAVAGCDRAPTGPSKERADEEAKANKMLSSPARRAFEDAKPAGDDFIINFGEPFLSFESRGDLLRLHDRTSGERVTSWIDAERVGDDGRFVFEGEMTDPYGDDHRFEIEVEASDCEDEFSGEFTDFTAWYGHPASGRRVRGCARIIGAQQRWPDGFDPT